MLDLLKAAKESVEEALSEAQDQGTIAANGVAWHLDVALEEIELALKAWA
jgi:hypothetical protein